MESNSGRTQTLQEIRKHSINFEQEKRRFDEHITKLHEEQISEISDLRNRLAAMTHVNARDQFRRERGRPYFRPSQRRNHPRNKPYGHYGSKHYNKA